MTKQEAYVLNSIASGLAWPVIVKILKESVDVEAIRSLDAETPEDASRAVFRYQGAKMAVDRFIQAAENAANQGEAE